MRRIPFPIRSALAFSQDRIVESQFVVGSQVNEDSSELLFDESEPADQGRQG